MDLEQTIDTIILPLANNQNLMQPQEKQSLRELLLRIFDQNLAQRSITVNTVQTKSQMQQVIQEIVAMKMEEPSTDQLQNESQEKILLSFSHKSSQKERSGLKTINRYPPAQLSKGLSFGSHSRLLSSLSESSNNKRQAGQESRSFQIFQGHSFQNIYGMESIKNSERRSIEAERSPKEQEKGLSEQKSEKVLKEFPKKSIHALRPKPGPSNAPSK